MVVSISMTNTHEKRKSVDCTEESKSKTQHTLVSMLTECMLMKKYMTKQLFMFKALIENVTKTERIKKEKEQFMTS